MGYLFMVLSLVTGLIKGFCGKKMSGEVNTVKGTFYMNMVRMLLCIVIGCVMAIAGGSSILVTDLGSLLIMAVSGISTAMFVVSWVFCVRRGSYVMIDVFLMLGGGFTVVLCKLFFNEAVTVNQIIGFTLLMIASIVMCSYSSNIKGSFTFSSFLWLIVCGAFNGVSNFAQKWFVYAQPAGSASVFNLYTYLFAAIVLFVSFAIADKTEKEPNDGKSTKVFLVICIMAICLFANSYFKTLAAKYIPSAILYPFTSGASIVLSSVMAAVFFKEKITKKCLAGIVITLAAIVIMNL